MNPLFWDVQHPMQGSSHAGADAARAARQAESTVRELEDRIDKLSLICCAMWTVIQAHTDVGDDELVKLVQELDLSDGIQDGKARVEKVHQCTQCQRPVATRHLRCIYCGAPRQSQNPFDNVL
jgi:hypothetical protein